MWPTVCKAPSDKFVLIVKKEEYRIWIGIISAIMMEFKSCHKLTINIRVLKSSLIADGLLERLMGILNSGSMFVKGYIKQ